MVDYLSQFIPVVFDLTPYLRKFPKKDVIFQYMENHEKDFQELKNNISFDACLQYCNLSKPGVLQVDASRRGLETVLIQKDFEG